MFLKRTCGVISNFVPVSPGDSPDFVVGFRDLGSFTKQRMHRRHGLKDVRAAQTSVLPSQIRRHEPPRAWNREGVHVRNPRFGMSEIGGGGKTTEFAQKRVELFDMRSVISVDSSRVGGKTIEASDALEEETQSGVGFAMESGIRGGLRERDSQSCSFKTGFQDSQNRLGVVSPR